MKCPFCGNQQNKVVDSRTSRDGEAVRRRRECLGCHKRFTTYEYVETSPLMVVKRDGRREPFDRQKLLNGMLMACGKRPIPREKIEAIADRIQRHLTDKAIVEVSSPEIGQEVMAELRRLDEISYIRFASVYRQFKDTREFADELDKLLRRGK